jgi:hypothetical protein
MQSHIVIVSRRGHQLGNWRAAADVAAVAIRRAKELQFRFDIALAHTAITNHSDGAFIGQIANEATPAASIGTTLLHRPIDMALTRPPLVSFSAAWLEHLASP